MTKLSLTPSPTFKAKVGIPVPGGAPAPVEFTFKHRTRAEVAEWLASRTEDAGVVMDIATGWDLDDVFNGENAERLCEAYMGAAQAIVTVYLDELRGARAKN